VNLDALPLPGVDIVFIRTPRGLASNMIDRYQATARSRLLRTILLRSEVALGDRYRSERIISVYVLGVLDA
jgi:hypothetical protein